MSDEQEATQKALELNRRIREAVERAEKAEAALVLAQREIDRLLEELTKSDLRDEIAVVINCASAKIKSNTPDFILASFLSDCLKAFDRSVNAREAWYGRATENPLLEPEPEPELCEVCNQELGKPHHCRPDWSGEVLSEVSDE